MFKNTSWMNLLYPFQRAETDKEYKSRNKTIAALNRRKRDLAEQSIRCNERKGKS